MIVTNLSLNVPVSAPTGLSYPLLVGILVSSCPSVRPSVDGIVFALYLPQYSPDPFHFHTSYQQTSEGVPRVEFFISKFDFLPIFLVQFVGSTIWPLPMIHYELDLWSHPWPWPRIVYIFHHAGYPRLLCSQPVLVVLILYFSAFCPQASPHLHWVVETLCFTDITYIYIYCHHVDSTTNATIHK